MKIGGDTLHGDWGRTPISPEDQAFYDGLSDREIRRRQAICEEQIGRAHASRNDEALANLRKTEAALTEAMLKRC